jgi:uncharacterized protein YdaU (DUF1376 family)
MHYFKRNIGDYHKKAGRLSMLEHGAYTLLLDACYDREQFPTLEQAIEWCWARSAEEVAAVEFVLRKFFTLEGDVYIQNRIQEEITQYKENAKTNKRIAEEREARRKQTVDEPSTKRERSVNEAPPNHKPLTNNHKPVTNDKGANAPVSQKFTPPSHVDLVEAFSGKVFDPATEATKFLAYYQSNGWKVGRNPMKSWQSAVAGWAARSNSNAVGQRPVRQSAMERAEQNIQAAFAPQAGILDGDFHRIGADGFDE